MILLTCWSQKNVDLFAAGLGNEDFANILNGVVVPSSGERHTM